MVMNETFLNQFNCSESHVTLCYLIKSFSIFFDEKWKDVII